MTSKDGNGLKTMITTAKEQNDLTITAERVHNEKEGTCITTS